MNKKFLMILAVAVLLLTPVMASATVVIPYGPNATLNCWDDFTNFKEYGTIIVSEVYGQDPVNPPPVLGFGEIFGPQVADGAPFVTQILNGPTITGFAFATSALGNNDPEVSVKLFNFPYQETPKNIKVGVYFTGNRYIDDVVVDLYKEGVKFDTKTFTDVAAPVDAGYTKFQEFEIQIYPNPDLEVLTFKLGGNSDWQVDKLCIATQCVPAPIPGSMLLLGSGILGLVGVGLRRKSS